MTVKVRTQLETYQATVTIPGDFFGQPDEDFEVGLGTYETPGAFQTPDEVTINGHDSATVMIRVGAAWFNPVAATYRAWGRELNAPDITLTRGNTNIVVITTGGSPIDPAVEYVQTVNGVGPDADGNVDVSGGGGGAVDSVNGQTGVVVLDATDVGADPAGSAATAQTAAVASADAYTDGQVTAEVTRANGAYDAAGAATTAQAAAISAAATDATTKANAAQAAAISSASTDATTKANAAQAAAIAAAATDATTKANAAQGASQPLDADLTTIAALDATTAGALSTDGSGWIRKTYAQLKTALALVKGDVGLGNVDNTSDANKPVSTAQATAIAGKASALTRQLKTANYTAVVGDEVACDTTAGTFTVTLPAASGGRGQVVVKWIAGTDSPTIALSGSDQFNKTAGGSSGTFKVPNHASTYDSDGTSIWTVRENLPLASLDLRYQLTNVEGLKAFAYGHSYATGTGASNSIGWAQRLLTRLRFGGLSNQAIGGMCMADICTKAAQTWSVNNQGVVFVEGVINDAQNSGSARSVLGFTNGIRSFIEIVRCAAKQENTSATYTGTWTHNAADPAASGSTSSSTTTQNDSFLMNIAGTSFTLLFFGNDDTSFGTAGGTVSVSVDGTVVATQSLSNQMVVTTYSTPQKKVHVPIIITGQTPGYHKVVCTKTDATGSIVAFDCALTPNLYPPTVVLVKDGQVPGKGFTTTIVNAYNTVLDTMVTLYPTNHVVAVPVSSSWTGTTTVSAADGLHPGDYGHEVILNQIAATVAAIPFRGGMGTPALTDVAAAATPVSPSDNFNRADNANILGVTSTGAIPWQAENAGISWGIVSNRAYCPSGSGSATVETGKTDCTITATVAVGSASNYGILFRYGDNGSGLIWFAGAGLYTMSGGALGSSIATPGNYTVGDTVQIITSGTSITFKKNGTTLTTITSAIGQGNTRHGFRSNAATDARWDDFSVA